MAVVDTKAWKQFRLGDLFDVVPTKGKNTYGLEDGCDLAYIAASRENNGVNRMIAKDNMADFISAGNCLVFIHIGDAAAGFCHYVRDDFVGMAGKTSCGYLKNHVMTETLGLFLAGVIRNVNEGLYSFGESWTGNRLMDTMLPLPATPDGQPDWSYMDAYMSEVLKKEEVFAEHLASLTAEAVADGHKLDTSGWKAFRIEELFEVLLAKGDIQPKQVADGTIPLVSAGNEDNGIVSFIDAAGDGVSEMFPAGCITVSMFGRAFYQPACFYAVSHGRINVLRAKIEFSSIVGAFLAACLSHMLGSKYDYATMCTQKKLVSEEIYLPVTVDGQPDWAWMEQYMQQQMDKAEALVEHLDAVWN